MSEETGNVLTFGELRKKQKEENREDNLLDLDDKFLLRVSNYLDQKKEAEGESREFKNAKRVLDKIISLREQKIVKKSRLAVKTDLKASKLDLLPEEQELFRQLKQVFKDHRDTVDETVEKKGRINTGTEGSSESENVEDSETANEVEEEQVKEENPTEAIDETEDEGQDVEDGYKIVKITSEVPEFMGTDLEAYGPFDAGEEVEVPDDNAEILVNRGNAELVEE